MSTRITAAVVVCDRCSTTSPPVPGIGPARAAARGLGWVATGGGLADLCPNCRHEVEARRNGSSS